MLGVNRGGGANTRDWEEQNIHRLEGDQGQCYNKKSPDAGEYFKNKDTIRSIKFPQEYKKNEK